MIRNPSLYKRIGSWWCFILIRFRIKSLATGYSFQGNVIGFIYNDPDNICPLEYVVRTFCSSTEIEDTELFTFELGRWGRKKQDVRIFNYATPTISNSLRTFLSLTVSFIRMWNIITLWLVMKFLQWFPDLNCNVLRKEIINRFMFESTLFLRVGIKFFYVAFKWNWSNQW